MASENYFAHLSDCQAERREEGRGREQREVGVRGKEGDMGRVRKGGERDDRATQKHEEEREDSD